MVTINNFEYLKALTKGAYGKVYLGQKTNDPSKKYAIKVISKEEMRKKNMTQQVLAERNALAFSHSDYVVHLYYSLQSKSNVYLVMEYLPGGDLKSLISVSISLPESLAAIYTQEIMKALIYLHNHDIIHRDIKPDNVLIGKDGHLKLTDFGLSYINFYDNVSKYQKIMFTPSQKFREKNTEFTRTPNQVNSLLDNLFENSSTTNFNPITPKIKNRKIGSRFNDLECTGIKQNKENNLDEHYSIDETKALCTKSPQKVEQSTPELRNRFKTPQHKHINRKNSIISKLSLSCKQLKTKYSNDNSLKLCTEEVADLKIFNPPLNMKDFDDETNNQSKNNDNNNDMDVQVRGSPDYLAPEMLKSMSTNNMYQQALIDWWALGVIVFEMLTGYTPFGAETVDKVFEKIINHRIDWPLLDDNLNEISIENIDLSNDAFVVINGLLESDWSTRWTSKELSKSSFIINNPIPEPGEHMLFMPQLDNDVDTQYHDTRNEKVLQMSLEAKQNMRDCSFVSKSNDTLLDEDVNSISDSVNN